MSIGFSIARAASKPKKASVPPGVYESIVTSVAYADEYVDGEAIDVRYLLTAADGSEFEHKEIFYNTLKNRRTREFFEYLEEIGIPDDALEEFVGTKEKLVLKRSTQGRYLTIESREFIASGGDAE